MSPGPLDGVRVVDTTRFPPGAYLTQLLAGLGADVWRVDGPGWDPAMMGIGPGTSRGKRSVTIDLRHPRGHEVLRRLAASADVLVENEKPGAMEARGFGPALAARETPRLVWVSLTGFGQEGPYATWPGHDITYTAFSGLLTSLAPELPWLPQAVLAVPLGAMMAATGVVAALLERERTGTGTHLDVSLAESATWLLSGADQEINGTPWGIPYGAERNIFECADGRWISTAAAEPKTWAALAAGLGLEAAGERPGGDDREATLARVREIFRTRPQREWVERLGPAGAAVAPVHRGPDLKDDPHVRARGGLVEVDGVHVPALPIRFRENGASRPTGPGSGAPAPGSHTREILQEAGLGDDEIEAYRSAGAVG